MTEATVMVNVQNNQTPHWESSSRDLTPLVLDETLHLRRLQ